LQGNVLNFYRGRTLGACPFQRGRFHLLTSWEDLWSQSYLHLDIKKEKRRDLHKILCWGRKGRPARVGISTGFCLSFADGIPGAIFDGGGNAPNTLGYLSQTRKDRGLYRRARRKDGLSHLIKKEIRTENDEDRRGETVHRLKKKEKTEQKIL